MRDLAQITMPRRAAITINNLALLGYYVALINSGMDVTEEVLRLAVVNSVQMLRPDVPGNATKQDLEEAFTALGCVPVMAGDNVASAVRITRHGVSDGA